MKERIIMTLMGAVACMLTATAQLPTTIPSQGKQTAGQRIERINRQQPGIIKAKGLTPEQADLAVLAARNYKAQAPRKSGYDGPDANQQFWFVMPEGTKLGYVQGVYYSVGNDGALRLLAEDATHNMSARFNGALVNGKLHTLSGDLSWKEYGLVLAHDHVYDPNSDWQLYKSVDLGDWPYLLSQEVAVDPKSQRVYGSFLRDDLEGYDIAWVNYDTKEIHRIGPAQRDYPGLGMNAEGKLFGVDMDGVLYEISLEDGSDHAIGSTGISVRDEDDRYFYQSAECGVKDNVLYWAATLPDGSSALYAVNLETAEATKITDYPAYTLIHCLTVPATMAADDAPAAVTSLQALFDKTSTTGQLSFTLPTTTYDGQGLTGEVGYIVRTDGADLTAGQALAGSDVTVPLTLAEGLHLVEVYATNSHGRSPQACIHVFTGLDKPGEVLNPQLAVHGRQATVTWEPAVGVNGGYPGELTYSVRRNPDNKIVAQHLTETTYTEQIPEGSYRQVSYSIVPTSDVAIGVVATTRSIAVGTPYELPYQESFLSSDDFTNNYTVADANNDGVSWVANISTITTAAVYSFNTGSQWTNLPADDWLFTPAFMLEAGRRYKLTFREACYGSEPQCINKIEVRLGRGADIEAMATELLPVTEFRNNEDFSDVVVEFTAPGDGDYNIGFHAVSDQRKSDFMLDQIVLEEAYTDNSPAAVAGLVVTPGSEGMLAATISFTAPERTLGGEELTSLKRIRIMRHNQTLHTFETPTPGEPLSFTDPTATNGFNTYTVVATNDVSDGPMAQQTSYVGLDIPQFDYASVGAEDHADHITVRWAQVGTTGLNGGYVVPAQVGYAVYNIIYEEDSGYMSIGDYVGMVVGSDHLDIPVSTDSGDQRVLSYAILATNEIGADENHVGATYGLPVGQPYPMPFVQSAANCKLGNRMMWAETENNAEATYTFSTDSYDNDNGSFLWAPTSSSFTLKLNTGKISLAGSNNARLVFAHKAEPGVRFQLSVLVQTPDREETELKRIDYHAMTGDEAAWTLENIDLSSFKGEDYVVVKFSLSSNAATDRSISGKTIQIDAINVLDMQPYNLSIDLETPATLVAGRGSDIGMVVHNTGERDASGFEVRLFADGEELCAETISESLPSLESRTVNVRYVPSVFSDADRITLRAELSWMYDLDDEDNLMEAEVPVTAPMVQKPQNAIKTTGDEGDVLAWDVPEQVVEQATESFEGAEFTDFDLCGITTEVHEGMMGEWTVWNLDADGSWNGPHGPTGKLPNYDETELENISFPNMQEVCAWMVFNSAAAVGTMPISPLTGNKMAATFDDFVQQDTWLITPELSGNKQTITFYAAAPVTYDWLTGEIDQQETIEVLISSGGLVKDDFESLGTATFENQEWGEFEVDVPAGTRYMAIRNISDSYNAMAMFVDDVTYERLSALPVSYNIYGDGQLVQNVAESRLLAVSESAAQYAVTAVYANGDESLPTFFTEGTGIREIARDGILSPERTVYDLQGRRIVCNRLQRGVYIVGGQTVIAR